MSYKQSKKSKGDLLEHYSQPYHGPNAFLQFDAFYCPEGGDSFVHPDNDGDWLSGGATWDLMGGPPGSATWNVRILVQRKATKNDALRAIKKLRKWIKNGGFESISQYLSDEDTKTDSPF